MVARFAGSLYWSTDPGRRINFGEQKLFLDRTKFHQKQLYLLKLDFVKKFIFTGTSQRTTTTLLTATKEIAANTKKSTHKSWMLIDRPSVDCTGQVADRMAQCGSGLIWTIRSDTLPSGGCSAGTLVILSTDPLVLSFCSSFAGLLLVLFFCCSSSAVLPIAHTFSRFVLFVSRCIPMVVHRRNSAGSTLGLLLLPIMFALLFVFDRSFYSFAWLKDTPAYRNTADRRADDFIKLMSNSKFY